MSCRVELRGSSVIKPDGARRSTPCPPRASYPRATGSVAQERAGTNPSGSAGAGEGVGNRGVTDANLATTLRSYCRAALRLEPHRSVG